MQQIDEIDVKILQALIKNARTKLKDIAENCDISITAIKRRIDNLKKKQLIIKSSLIVDMEILGYPINAVININLNQEKEKEIIDIVNSFAKVGGINKTVGVYDLCLVVFTKSIDELDQLKHKIRNRTGVKTIDVNIWNKIHINYSNLVLEKNSR